MYLQNKYTTWYNNIISRAQSRTLTGYVERHHIIPHSLGGSNSKHNLVRLTAREHFICHRLLVKMVTGEEKTKMIYAVWAMGNLKNEHHTGRYIIKSHTYHTIRKQRAAEQTARLTGKTGPPCSEETKQKISASLKGKSNGPQSPEWVAKRTATCKGRPSPTKGKTTRPMSAESKAKLAESMRLRHATRKSRS